MMHDSSLRPTLVVVSGRPGSGKTTLARILARTLSFPLISRDEIRDGILCTFGCDPHLASKDYVAKCAFDAFFRTIKLLVTSKVTLVAEAAFQDERWRIGLEPLLPIANLKVIHCTIQPELAQQRAVLRRLERRDAPQSREHGNDPVAAEGLPAIRVFQPLSFAVPSLHVGTADGYDPPLDEIIAFIMSP